MSLLHPANLEVNIVGDFAPELLERLVLHYLGTLSRSEPAPAPVPVHVELQHPSVHERRISWHLEDSDERACAYMAGGNGPLSVKPQWQAGLAEAET